jgi:tetratricopeptide (TPR) repeat protein
MKAHKSVCLSASIVSLWLFGSLPLHAQVAGNGKRVALLIGVNRYDNRNLANLEFAERDVEELSRMLKDSYKVRMLLGSTPDESARATKPNVDKALDELFQSGLTKDDTVFIAVAGHGQQLTAERDGLKHDEPFFCPRDAVPGDAKTMLNLSQLIERLGERGGGTNLLLVDACRNDPDPTRGRGIDGDVVLSLPKGMAVFFSCSKGERAQESPKAGGGHGLFFHYVLEGLRADAARNSKGELRWERLVAFVKDKLEEDAPNLLGPGVPVQTPHEVANLARSPIVLERVRAGAALASANEYITRGNDWYAKRDYDRALDDYTEAIRLDAKSAVAFYNRGLSWKNKKQYDKALTEFDQAIGIDPNDARFFNNRGLAWYDKGNLDKAIHDYNEAIRLDAKDPQAYHGRGVAWMDKGVFGQALEDFDKALELNPKYALAYHNRGWMWAKKREYDKAIDNYNKSIDLEPGPAVHLNRGVAYMESGEYDKALPDFSKAIELDPKYALAYHNRGWLQARLREYDKAIEDYSSAIRLDPKDSSIYLNRGRAWSEKRENDKAIADYDEAIRINPRYALAYQNRGWLRFQTKEFDRALADYSDANRIDPKDASNANGFAWFLATCPQDNLRDGQRALTLATMACETASWKDPRYMDTLSAAYAETGNFQKAIEMVQKALEYPEYDKVYGKGARDRLQSYRDGKPYRDQ